MNKYILHRLFWNYEKEEKWLNEMASKGMNFIDLTFARYLFEKGAPGEYIYRLELLQNTADHLESQAYIEFMESVGVEYMGKWVRWVYFRKKASEGPFEVFSDLDSKIRNYKSVGVVFLTVGLVNLCAVLINGVNLINSSSAHYTTHITPMVSLNAVIAVSFAWIFIKYRRKIGRLKKEKQLHE